MTLFGAVFKLVAHCRVTALASMTASKTPPATAAAAPPRLAGAGRREGDDMDHPPLPPAGEGGILDNDATRRCAAVVDALNGLCRRPFFTAKAVE